MLKTSGNRLRSCGENDAAFLRPISLDRPVGNCGQYNDQGMAECPAFPFYNSNACLSQHPVFAGIFLRLHGFLSVAVFWGNSNQ